MSREILFRAKRIGNGEWVEGYYARSGGFFILRDNGNYGGFEMFEVDPETVCQCTGLRDKNGRKIFEGDIADIPYSKKQGLSAEVRYDNMRGSYGIRRIGYIPISLKDVDEWCVIIGNRFDNPELLKGGKV